MFLEAEGALAASHAWAQLQPLGGSLLEGVARLPKQLLGARPRAARLRCPRLVSGTAARGLTTSLLRCPAVQPRRRRCRRPPGGRPPAWQACGSPPAHCRRLAAARAAAPAGRRPVLGAGPPRGPHAALMRAMLLRVGDQA